METLKKIARRPLLTQVTNNTSFWIGHRPNDSNDHYAGQTFASPADSTLDNIQVYAEVVQQPGDIKLTLHHFDAEKKIWGAAMGSATVSLTRNDKQKWVPFALPDVKIHKGNTYGFQLQSSDALVAVGEAAGCRENPPFASGQEWTATSNEQAGHFFTYFSLAFKIEVC